MSDILTDYREWRDAQPERVATHSDRCHLWHERCMIHRLAAALERARLTDAEREAITAAMRLIDGYEEEMDGFSSGAAATLRGLLDRTQ